MRPVGLLLVALIALAPGARAERVWEVNGIRLEADQVDRLADELAERTVQAVLEKVEGLDLSEAQRKQMHEIYRDVALDVYERVVEVIEDDSLGDAEKEERARELALEGQRRSHARLEAVLSDPQMALYSRWEHEQVDAFQSRRLDSRRRRRRR
ncbi:MAG: hypothetical protein ACE5FG_09665 [Myxococcota bacterium]